jgi:Pentapeptide repeats (8 copies)
MPPRRPGRPAVNPRPRPSWQRPGRATPLPGPAGARRDWAARLGVITALIAALGALVFNAVSVTATNRQIELTRQGQVTDRYTAAVAQLGSDSIDVRLGGIYALERLMTDSSADQPTIVEVLAAFIRDNAGKRAAIPAPTATPDPAALVAQHPADILAAFTVLGRRDIRHDAPGQTVDLSFTDLTGLYLVAVKLPGVNFTATRLQGAYLAGADLAGADLSAADLAGAHLQFANLTCADLLHANLTRADLSDAHLTGVVLVEAKLTGANLANAEISAEDSGTTLDGTSGTPRPASSASTTPRCHP